MDRIVRSTALSLFLCAAGCGGNEPQVKQPEPSPPIRGEATPEATTAPRETMEPRDMTSPQRETASPDQPPAPPPEATTPPPPPALADDQILQALHTANAGEIEQAKLAQQKAKNTRVKSYATMMLKDHTEADTKGRETAKKANVTPSMSDVSRDLESDVKQTTTSLSSQKGGDFDREYLDAQVKEHQAVIDLIDKQLMPNAKSADVKSLLQTIRPKVEGHLKDAELLRKNLPPR